MGFPQTANRVASAPLQAMRAIFAGIGRILMSADRPDRSIGDPTAFASEQTRWRSLDQTGNVRLLSAQDFEEGLAASSGPAAVVFRDASASAQARIEPAVADPAEAAEPALPLAAYDTLSLPSIRARLRSLDANQLRVLVAYEQANAERPEVLGMLGRRIEKLEAGG